MKYGDCSIDIFFKKKLNTLFIYKYHILNTNFVTINCRKRSYTDKTER